jgi:hypothetical protein
MGEIATNFLDSVKLAKKKTKSSTGISCLGIPAGFSDDFISTLSARLSLPAEKTASEASKLMDNPFIGRKEIDGEYFFCWRDIAMEKFQHNALNDPRTHIFDCVMMGVQDFWEKHVPEAQRRESSRIKSYHGPRASLGIPESALSQFYEWYKLNLKRGFKEYDINGSSESLKHTIDLTSSPESRSKKVKTTHIHVSSDESDAEAEPHPPLLPVEPQFSTGSQFPVGPPFPVEPQFSTESQFSVGPPFPVEPSPFAMSPITGEYFSSNILTNMDMLFPGSESQLSRPGVIFPLAHTETSRQEIVSPTTNTDKSGMTLYTEYLCL